MRYLYKCKECEIKETINKPISKVDEDVYCKICESKMEKVYTAPATKTADGMKVSKS